MADWICGIFAITSIVCCHSLSGKIAAQKTLLVTKCVDNLVENIFKQF